MLQLDPIFEILTILVASLLINSIPFAGPSNLLIASNAAIAAIDVDPFTIGVAVAFGSMLLKVDITKLAEKILKREIKFVQSR